jgi:cytochrome c-type biogenesis protein CcmE
LKPWIRLVLALAAVAVAVSALVTIVMFPNVGTSMFGEESMVYYWSPTELRDAGDKGRDATVRLGGMVRAGDDPEWDKKIPVVFYIEDGGHRVKVSSTGAPPQMFREGIGAIVEGRLGKDDVFHTHRVMVKHNNEYEPPKDGEMPDMKQMSQSMDGV